MRHYRALAVLAALPFLSSVAWGQPSLPLGTGYRVSGAQIPRSQQVESFLRTSHTILNELGEEFRLDLLQKLGIEPGSDAEKALREAAQKVWLLEFGEEGPVTTSEPEAGVVIHYRHVGPEASDGPEADLHQKAIETGKIYGHLLRQLREQKVPLENLERYLANEVAPGLSITSDQPFDANHPLAHRASAFEAEVQKALR